MVHRSGGKECVCSFCGCRLCSTMLWESSSGSSPVWSQDSLHHSLSWALEPWITWSALLLTFRRVSVCMRSLTPYVLWIWVFFVLCFCSIYILSLKFMYKVSQDFSQQNSHHFIFMTIFHPLFNQLYLFSFNLCTYLFFVVILVLQLNSFAKATFSKKIFFLSKI